MEQNAFNQMQAAMQQQQAEQKFATLLTAEYKLTPFPLEPDQLDWLSTAEAALRKTSGPKLGITSIEFAELIIATISKKLSVWQMGCLVNNMEDLTSDQLNLTLLGRVDSLHQTIKISEYWNIVADKILQGLKQREAGKNSAKKLSNGVMKVTAEA